MSDLQQIPFGLRAGVVALWLSSTLGAGEVREVRYDFVADQAAGLLLDRGHSSPLEPVTIEGQRGVRLKADADGRGRAVFRLAEAARWTGPADLAAVLEYYDRSSDKNRPEGGDALQVLAPQKAPPNPEPVLKPAAWIGIACRPEAAEPYRAARWRCHAVILRQVWPDKGPEGIGLELQADAPLVLRAIRLRSLTPAAVKEWEALHARIRDEFLRQTGRLIQRVRVEEIARQVGRASRYSGDAGLPEAAVSALTQKRTALLELFRQAETLADRHYYEGRLAVVEGRAQDLKALEDQRAAVAQAIETGLADLLAQTQAALAGLEARRTDIAPGFEPVARLVVPPHPLAQSIPAYFRQRVRFLFFDNSGMRLPDMGYWYDLYRLYGVDARFYVSGYQASAPAAGRDPWAAATAWIAGRLADDASRGFQTVLCALHIHNVLILGGLPEWFRDRHKDEEYLDRAFDGQQNTTGQGSGTVNIWHAGIRHYVRDYAATVGRQAAACPTLVGFCTFNEFSHQMRYQVSLGYTRLAAEAFRAALRHRYKDVATLNRQWGSQYAAFEDIQPPRPVEHDPWQISPLAYEWHRFRRQSLEGYAQEMIDAYKAACPDKPIWFEGGALHLADIGHCHVRPIPDVAIANHRIRRVYQRAVADAETGGGHYPEGEKECTAEVARAAAERNLFNDLLWDQRAFTFWFRFFTSNANGYYARFHDDPNGAPVIATRDCSSLAVIRDKADRFNDLLVNTRIVPSGVGLVRGGEAGYWGGLPEDEFRVVATNLYVHGYQPFDVSADDLADGRESLDAYQALYVMSSPVAREELQEKLSAWIRGGGLAFLVGPWGWRTPGGRLDGRLLKEAFGDLDIEFPPADEAKRRALLEGSTLHTLAGPYETFTPWRDQRSWTFRFDPKRLKNGTRVLLANTRGEPILVEAPLGRGKVIMSTIHLYAFMPLVLQELSRRHVRRAAWADVPLYSVLREDARGRRYLGLVNPDSARGLDTTVTVEGILAGAEDLGCRQGFPIPVKADPAAGVSRFRVALEPGEGTILRLRRSAEP